MATTTANVGSSTYSRMKSSIAELSLSKSCIGLGGGGGFCVNVFNKADVTHCTLISNHKLRFFSFFSEIEAAALGAVALG